MKRKRLTQKERQLIYEKYQGHCAYCGCPLEFKEMQVDHIDSVRRHEEDGLNVDFMDNYNPSCRMCNFYKDTLSIDDFRRNLSLIIERLTKRVFIFRLALKYGLLSINNQPIQFYFENTRKKDSNERTD
ncbi:HNH endonuclease [Selenomonas ruminantium]|uniref:HNH endonuclease n=1 Tax=Selenomonas ruminantium TaxID=971 RepID=UPI0026EB1181|nr:HNH endonuclease signature motif containing protein [Selenomonas ruminantium]